MKKITGVFGAVLLFGFGAIAAIDSNRAEGPIGEQPVKLIVADANTILLDHFDDSTSGTILGFSENGAPCGTSKPTATPAYSWEAGPYGLNHALTLAPPTGQPAGSCSYLRYAGGQLLSQANGTIEFWVYLTSYGTGSNMNMVDQGQYYTACMGWTFGMGVNSSGQLWASAWNAFSMNSGVHAVPLNTWTHVAATWGSSGAKLYINGAQVGSDANTGMPASGYGGQVMMTLGTGAGATTKIDELQISNVQRTWADTTPDSFTFTDQTGVNLSTVITSNAITVTGINTATAISIAGGTYSINGGSYTSAGGTVIYGDSVTVQQTSSGSYSTTTNAMLTIGGASDTFSVTTGADITPQTVTVTSPNGGETWVFGSSHNITWTTTGAIADVRIEYSTTNGAAWTSVIASTPNDGSHSWTLPYASSTQCLIRVSDASNAAVLDVSNAAFSIYSDATEPNDNSASAATLPLGTTENLIYDGGDNPEIDWYKFYVPPADTGKDLKVNVRITSPYPVSPPPGWGSDIDFELLDGGLAVRGITQSASDNETLYLANVAAGWYYIYIGYCTDDYADSTDHARYSVTLETGTSFGVGYLHGRVVDGVGQGIGQVFLTLFHVPGNWNVCFPAVTSASDGSYTIAFLPGTYDLQAAGKAGGRSDGCKNQAQINVVAEYYNDKKAASLADHVTVSAGGTANLSNIILDTGAIVSGRVTDGGGSPLANAWVVSYDAQGYSPGNSVLTNTNGDYSLNGVPIGGAKIFFYKTGWDAPEYYNDKPSFGSGDLLATQAGVTIPNVNAQMTWGGTVSGTVQNGSGSGVSVNVRLYSVLDSGFSAASVTSAAGTGVFNFYNVKPGDFKIWFNSMSAGYSPEWYNDKASFAEATVINVTEGGTNSGILAQLAAVANSMTVTSPNGGETWIWGQSHDITWTTTGAITNVKIEYSTDNGATWTTLTASTTNDGSHTWLIPYTSSTHCRVRVSDASNAAVFDVSDGAFNIFSDGMEPNYDPATAATLALGPTENLIYDGGDNPEIDWYKFYVPPADAGKDLKVNVRITSPYPVSPPPGWGSDIDFELLDGGLAVRGITQSSSDNETLYLANVAAGWYYIYIGYCTDDYADSTDHARYSVTLETGTSFGVGYLHGRVVDGVGQGIGQVFLTLFHVPGNWNVCFPAVTSASDGSYTIAFLPGTYDLQAAGKAGGRPDGCKNQAPINVVAEYYNDKKAASLADHVTVSAGGTANLSNIVLDTGAIVTGRVTDGAGNPLGNIWVASYDGQGYSASNLALTNGNGDYSLNGVPIGGAKILFYKTGSVAPEYYNDKPSFGSGDLLATQVGVTIPNVNAQMTWGGTVSGTVQNGSGSGVSVNVRLYSVLDSGFSAASVTSAAGTGVFNFYNIKPGDFKIYFNSAAAGYAPEWYNDAASFASATVVTVTEGGTTSGIVAQLASLAPEINIKQGAASIASGGTYDFSTKTINTDTDVVFTVENIGNANLTLTSLPLTIGGTDAGQFSVTAQPVSPVTPAGNTTFTVRFRPTTIGAKTAQISIANNDGDENPYLLNLTGSGAAVVSTIGVSSPNGGETWLVGSGHDVTWTSAGTIANVMIECSTNSGSSYTTVVPSTPNDGSYAWTIPNTLSMTCLVRVSDAANASVNDVSNGLFTIAAAPVVKDDLLGTWDGLGVYCRTSETGIWTALGPAAEMIACGDLFGDTKDDLFGVWASLGGTWFKNSLDGVWTYLCSAARHLTAGDMNGDGRTDLLGTWDGIGVFYRDSISGQWVLMAPQANKLAAGDLDGDGKADLIGLWPGLGEIWYRSSLTGAWSFFASAPRDFTTGDMNADGRADLVGTWDGLGVYYRDSVTGWWVLMAPAAEQVTTGDLDGDGIDDLVGIWPALGGVWVKYSSTGGWTFLGPAAHDITTGKMAGGIWASSATGRSQLNAPMGGYTEGPDLSRCLDLSADGPGGDRFVYQVEKNLIPGGAIASLLRIPGPGEPGFRWIEQKDIWPQTSNEMKDK